MIPVQRVGKRRERRFRAEHLDRAPRGVRAGSVPTRRPAALELEAVPLRPGAHHLAQDCELAGVVGVVVADDPHPARQRLSSWKLEDANMGPAGTYTLIKVGEGTGGGMMKQLMPDAPSAWLAYVLVDDIQAATQKAKSLGATVIKDVTEVMGAGWFSIILDPTGAALGLWKPKTG